MKLKIIILCFYLSVSAVVGAQTTDAKAAASAKRDSMLLTKLNAKGTYPEIKASKFCGVMPVSGITEKPEANMKYKLLFNFTAGTSDSIKVKSANRGLAEIGRIINLHIAAGVSKENIEIVIVSHGKALFALLNNEAFKKQFKADNPNLGIIGELQAAGAKFIACGQAMQFLDIGSESLTPTVKIATAAKVELSTYQLKGYAMFDITED
jgi:intracellular sulfur oxidation DsrE/DsrF family protein